MDKRDNEGQLPPLVCVHGFPLDSGLWRAQQPLAEHLRLVRLDLPGFGAAPPPPRERGMRGYAEAVLAAMDQAGIERAVLCGLSMGGYVLFELWRLAPERISALILCNTRAEADPAEVKQSRTHGIELLRQGRRAEVTDPFPERLLSAPSQARLELVREVREMVRRIPDEGVIAALFALRDRPDSTATLASITVPTLVVAGAEDRVTPPAVLRGIHAAIAGSRLVEIPGAGHLTPLEQPGEFNGAVLRFLS